ncbi:MAG: hypothetical protein LH629_07625, partial [Ignavibacteria bacterium]|nr:hypothetical protein [Ignavibacteria bacterium]
AVLVESDESKEIDQAKTEIIQSILREINKRIITESEQIEVTFAFDIQLQKAIEVLENNNEYNRLLGK